MEIGIIGFGSFGQLVADELKKDFKVYAWNRSDRSREAKRMGVGYVSIEEAASKDIVILSTSISSFEEILKKVKVHVKKGCLVADVCSVKEYSVGLMKKILPKDVEILGTHPLFGPDSFRFKENRKIVLCPVRIKNEKLEGIKSYLEKRGYKTIITTPKKHDIEIAKTQALVHFIGRALERMDLKENEIDVMTYRKLLEILRVVKNDGLDVFMGIEKNNRHAKKVREEFVKNTIKLNEELR